MIVFITGASGFVGGRVVELALKNNAFDQVRILARDRTSGKIPQFSNDARCVVYEGSLSDVKTLQKATEDVDVIIHCAAVVTDWAPQQQYYDSNVMGTQNLLEVATKLPHLQRFLHVSTTDVYGYPVNSRETTEDKPMKETSLPYNATKVRAEKLVWKAAQGGLPVTVVRPCNVYGPGSKVFVEEIAELIKEGSMINISGGKTSAGMVHVDNVANAILVACTSSATIGEAYNICDESGDISWKDYNMKLAKSLNLNAKIWSFPFSLIYFLGYVMEFIWGLLGIKSRPLLTRHAAYLLGRDQFFPVEKAKKHFHYQELVRFEEGITSLLTGNQS